MRKGHCPLIRAKCPESASRETGCPCWVEGIVETNQQGEQRVTAECVLRMLPRWMTQSAAANAVNAGELSAMRSGVMRAVGQGAERMKLEVVQDPRQLEEGDDGG